jgi:hypothetical protein
MRHKRLLSAALLVASIVAFADVLVVPVLVDDRLPCERAKAWVAEHAGLLPTTLDELSKFPAEYRRAIFAASPPAIKSALYREQYQRFAADRSLTLEQDRVLAEAIELASVSAYEKGTSDAILQQRLTALADKISKAFRDREDRLVFYRLGPEASGYSRSSWRVSLVEQLRAVVSASTLDPECTCNKASGSEECQISGNQCLTKPVGCQEVNPGNCGPNGNQICNGICQTPAR